MSRAKQVLFLCMVMLAVAGYACAGKEEGRVKILILDGENPYHDWAVTTPFLKAILDPYFQVSTVTIVKDEPFHANFSAYDVVLSNYNGWPWPEGTQEAFVAFVQNGGGFVSVHAADNAFPEWPEYNRLIGLGGWRGRNESAGPYLRFRDHHIVRDESPGRGGSHGLRHEFLVTAFEPQHPILKGLPEQWMHARDELYDRLRGPAQELEVLATAFSDKATGGTGEREPVLMTIQFGKGRVFHTVLGHSTLSMSGLGFQITLIRGVQWAAGGNVDYEDPDVSFLNPNHAVYRDPTGKEEGLWISLFNGFNLDGWEQKNGQAEYRVEKGAIVGQTAAGSPNSFLCTREEYGDFELKFEVQLEEPLNSGVQIRSRSLPDYDNGRVHGPQVEVAGGAEGSAGYIYSEATGRGWLSQDRSRQGLFKEGEWNEFRVRAVGPRIQTWLNGTQVEDLTDEESFRSGFIGLQVHSIPAGAGPYQVRWRNLFLRRLDRE